MSAIGATCESLAALKLPDTTIASAQTIAARTFVPPGAANPAAEALFFNTVPAFCRITAEVKLTLDSDIKIEVWMPVADWNGKYSGLGNGGYAELSVIRAWVRRSAMDLPLPRRIPGTQAVGRTQAGQSATLKR